MEVSSTKFQWIEINLDETKKQSCSHHFTPEFFVTNKDTQSRLEDPILNIGLIYNGDKLMGTATILFKNGSIILITASHNVLDSVTR